MAIHASFAKYLPGLVLLLAGCAAGPDFQRPVSEPAPLR